MTTSATKSLLTGLTPVSPLPSFLRQLWADWQKRSRRRRAIAALQALSDRSLADIGLDRSEIVSVIGRGGHDASRRAC